MSDNPAALQRLLLTDSKYCDNKEQLRKLFNSDIEDHVITVMHEDGLYRHLRFRDPAHGMYWFDLITWPGNLTINGDMGTYTFARVEDMFKFFTGYINTGYWAEKERSRGRSELKEHDGDSFKAWVVQDFWEYSRDMDAKKAKRWWASIREHVFARYASHDTDFREGCNAAMDEIIDDGASPGGHYEDLWENSWAKYPWHFEWSLAAIVTGIRTYNAVKKAEFLSEAVADPEGRRLAAAAVALAEAQK